jgi:hypothetical protein
MAKRATPEMIAEGLSVPERIMLFCVASATSWHKAGVTHPVAPRLRAQGLIDREATGTCALTDRAARCWKPCSCGRRREGGLATD